MRKRRSIFTPRCAALLLGLITAGCASEPPQNLLFISLDTTRSDHLSLYGYERPTTPRIDELGRSSAVFENAFAHSSTTNPTHASMFTSLYPNVHGVGTNVRKLADERLTLAEILGEEGFQTAGFVSGYPLRVTRTGLQQGFDKWDAKFKHMRRNGRLTTDRALVWLAERQSDESFFAFVHLYDAHGPYNPNAEYLGTFRSPEPGRLMHVRPKYQRVIGEDGEVIKYINQFVDRYDTQIRYEDDLVAELLDAVDLARTVVVIVADHGETLDDRLGALNLTHGNAVFDEQIRIPYLIYSPGIPAGRYVEPVEQVDLMPTLLDLLGVPAPPDNEFQGENLAPLLRGEREQRSDGLIFAMAKSEPKRYRDKNYDLEKRGRLYTVRSRRWKLVSYPGVEHDYFELYDVENDPGETIDVAADLPDTVERLRSALDAWLANEVDEAEELELSSEELEQMRALGYVD